ncbi:PD-(D/E)XK nuclease family protein [Bifidobacterium bombi]|uniref:PD-(D/E)XK nuclease family protein n=1 Tax=Bifidobacterium bombi TaxID=471511 RepID=UPI0005C59723|nr:PD-(D/E)XK nuclease family protein [Bifidobacterium bombi]
MKQSGAHRVPGTPRPEVSLVVGPPCSGKTTTALTMLLDGLERVGETNVDRVVMTVSNRKIADDLSDEVIHKVGSIRTARPVTTLAALSFRLLTRLRASQSESLPKLLNGAEQDALLRAVMAEHIGHAQTGELCDTCQLLRRYFATDDWADTVYAEHGGAAVRGSAVPAGTSHGEGGTEALFARGINDAFVMQLRDMLARMDELGVDAVGEADVLAALGRERLAGSNTERLDIQWRLAFALRREYQSMVTLRYPGEFRLDSSNLLVKGASAVAWLDRSALPELVIVDDFQDLTLAGLAFLEALSAAGVQLTLVGNADEAVQTFRGSYPEYLMKAAMEGPLHAKLETLAVQGFPQGEPSYRAVLSSRVSLSISSPEVDFTPLPSRPGKLPRWSAPGAVGDLGGLGGTQAGGDRRLHQGASGDSAFSAGGDVRASLYRSDAEELDDVVWSIKRLHLVSGDGHDWNDMAVIAHDNASVRAFGERLRRSGVPVRYSAVTRPLKDEPSIRGLFALIELAMLRAEGLSVFVNRTPSSVARFIRSRVLQLLESPLFETSNDSRHLGSPVRLDSVEAAMRSLGSLATVVREDGAVADQTGRSATLPHLVRVWDELAGRISLERRASRLRSGVDDSVFEGDGDEQDLPFGLDAMYLMLALGDGFGAGDEGAQVAVTEGDAQTPVQDVAAGLRGRTEGGCAATLEVIEAVGKGNPHVAAFARLWDVVDDVERRLRRLGDDHPQYSLWEAWDSCHVALRWQRQALGNDEASREANDRLDAVMQLFDYAAGSGSSQSVSDFMSSVRSMRIEADSLAKVAPIDQAVTLTTPAGAAGRHWRQVWIVQVQQGVWPNLAARNTMFGGEELARIVLHGTLNDPSYGGVPDTDPQLLSVLAAEQKSFLVALTRAKECVRLSAVLSDDEVPSDFLYTYAPEWYDRARDADTQSRRYSLCERHDRYAGLDADPRGLVGVARTELMRFAPDGSKVDATSGVVEEEPAGALQDTVDAARTLALLADGGVAQADPSQWAYLNRASSQSLGRRTALSDESRGDGAETHEGSHGDDLVVLSPSQVDEIWGCPVCWLLSRKFSGPAPSSSATGFGTLIHKVAQMASEEGLDSPDYLEGRGTQERIDSIAESMMEMYRGLRTEPDSIVDPAQRYKAIAKDMNARTTLGHIASYFVASNQSDYPGGNGKRDALKQEDIPIGILTQVQCEREFTAQVSFDDVLASYNAVPSVEDIGRTDVMGIMGFLVGGWPEGVSAGMSVGIHGTIDRLEWRRGLDATGEGDVRIVDYKTGHAHTPKAMFNDLQLVCYQLGLAFPVGDVHGFDGLSNGGFASARQGRTPLAVPRISKAMLFDTEKDGAPAAYGSAPEAKFQPPLFVSGHLNDTAFLARRGYPQPGRLYDVPNLPEEAPSGVSQNAWRGFVGLRGTQVVWSLTMISRVFYAAAASRSRRFTAYQQHDHYCTMPTVCPVCAGQVDTVYETRTA